MPCPHSQDRQPDKRCANCGRAQLDLRSGCLLGHFRAQHPGVPGGTYSLSQAVDGAREVLASSLDLRDQDIRITLCDGAIDGHRTAYFDRPARFRHDT
jgi:hypothetical protein